jgi:hypothetical protein
MCNICHTFIGLQYLACIYSVTVSELLLSDLCNLWYRAEKNDLCYFYMPRKVLQKLFFLNSKILLILEI